MSENDGTRKANLGKAQEDLRRTHAELERRVEERTAELSAANTRLQAEVAERQRAEEALRIQRDLGTALSSASTLVEAANAVLDATIAIGAIDCGAVYLADSRTGGFQLVAYRGVSREFVEASRHLSADHPRAQLIRAGRPTYAPFGKLSPEPGRQREGLRGFGMLPIAHRGQVVASLSLGSHVCDEIPSADRTVLETIASNLGGVLSRMRAEDALQEQLHLLGTLLDAIPHPVYFKDTSHRYLGCNKAFCTLTGQTREQVLGRTVLELNPAGTGDRHYQADCQVFQNPAAYAYEHTEYPETGQARHLFLQKAPFYDPTGRLAGLVGTITDVTDLKNTEQALAESESEYRALVANAPDAIFVTDVRTGRIVNANQKAVELTGRAVTELIGLDRLELHAPETREIASAGFRDAVAGQAQVTESQVVHADGRRTPVEMVGAALSRGGRTFVVGFFRDISERKRAEEELRRSETKTRAILEAIPDVIYHISRSGVYGEMVASKGFPLISPWSEYVGKNVRQITPPDFAGRVEQLIEQAFQTRQVQSLEYDVLDPNTGQTRFREARYVALDADDALCVARDITDRKLAERQLLAYQQQLRAMASQLSLTEERERRRIAGELHDRIGQALALAKIRLGAVSHQPLPPETLASLADIRAVIEQTLTDTRSLTFQLSPPILYELGFEPAAEWLAEQVRKQYAVRVDMDDDGQPKPMNDDVRVVLFQATRELLVNAAKHSRANRIRLSLARRGDLVRVQVSDDGVGFELAAVGPGKTTGFGLFSLRERIGPLGGSLQIDAAPGRGSRMTLLAPLKMD